MKLVFGDKRVSVNVVSRGDTDCKQAEVHLDGGRPMTNKALKLSSLRLDRSNYAAPQAMLHDGKFTIGNKPAGRRNPTRTETI